LYQAEEFGKVSERARSGVFRAEDEKNKAEGVESEKVFFGSTGLCKEKKRRKFFHPLVFSRPPFWISTNNNYNNNPEPRFLCAVKGMGN
jgi:hypothetical protein